GHAMGGSVLAHRPGVGAGTGAALARSGRAGRHRRGLDLGVPGRTARASAPPRQRPAYGPPRRGPGGESMNRQSEPAPPSPDYRGGDIGYRGLVYAALGLAVLVGGAAAASFLLFGFFQTR